MPNLDWDDVDVTTQDTTSVSSDVNASNADTGSTDSVRTPSAETETAAAASEPAPLPFEEFGTAEQVAELLGQFGGINQASEALRLWRAIQSEDSVESMLEKAHEVAPAAVEGFVQFIVNEAKKEFSDRYQKELFGRTLAPDEIERIRDLLAYGKDDEKFMDENGQPLPESVVGALKIERQRNKELRKQLQDLENRVASRIEAIESPRKQEAINKFTENILKPLVERAETMGLLKAAPGETPDAMTARVEMADVLEALTLRFLHQDLDAQKLLNQVEKRIADNSPASQAFIRDAGTRLQRRIAKAADKAAAFVSRMMGNAPVTNQVGVALTPTSAASAAAGNNEFLTSPTPHRVDDWEIDSNEILARLQARKFMVR